MYIVCSIWGGEGQSPFQSISITATFLHKSAKLEILSSSITAPVRAVSRGGFVATAPCLFLIKGELNNHYLVN